MSKLRSFITIVPLLAAHLSFADTRFDSFFSPGNAFNYLWSVEPSRDGGPRVTNQAAAGSAILQKNDRQTWTATARATKTDFTETEGIATPLWDVQGGFNFLEKTGDRRQWGVNAAIGSASDELFHSIRETELQATVNLMRPSRKTNAWVFLLNYSNNRSFLNNIPLPGFAYMWNEPQRGLRVVAGFPFLALNYQPTDQWAFKVSIIGPTNHSLETGYKVAKPAEIYVGLERNPQAWFLADREVKKNRFIYDEEKFLLGSRFFGGKTLTLDAAVGRSYRRRLFEAKDVTDNGPKRRLPNGPIFSAKLSLRF